MKTAHSMNSKTRRGSSGNYTEGTGAVGGWDKSEMKQYILDTIVPKVSQEIRNNVKTVTKYTDLTNTAGEIVGNSITQESFWIPSLREVSNQSYAVETQGASYASAFSTLQKPVLGLTNNDGWWLRSSRSSSNFSFVNSSGAITTINATYSQYIALGFCTN